MKQRLIKTTAFLFTLILIFSLFGCSSTSVNSNSMEDGVKAKTTETHKKQEQSSSKTAQVTVKQPAATNQPKTSVSTTTKTTASSGHSSKANVTTNTSSGKGSIEIASPKNNQAVKTVNRQAPPAVPSQPAAASKPAPKPQVQTVKLTITGPKEQPTINRSLTVKIIAGETVLDVLLNGIGKDNVDYTGSGASAYVRGIENVYEFDYGQNSGWTVSLNGTKLTRSAGIITVKANDKIAWVYTKDYTVNK